MSVPDRPRTGQKNDAFTILYEQHAARVFSYLQYRCNDPATAQDLTAQVFERVLRCLPGYDAERAPVSAWLFSIARHVVTDWLRRQYLRKFIPWEAFAQRPSGEPDPEQVTVESEERRCLRQALMHLSQRERDMIGLRFSGGLTNRAIAEITGLGESNVAVILYRALRKLRQHLAEPMEIYGTQPAPLAEVDHE